MLHFVYRVVKKFKRKVSTRANIFKMKLMGVKIGKRIAVDGSLYIKSSGIVKIGDNVVLKSSPTANPIGAGNRIYIVVGEKGGLYIGDNTKISNSAFTTHSTNIEIGENVYIGSGCHFYATDFHSLNPYARSMEKEPIDMIKQGNIRISDYVFIGMGCTILKNVTIGKYSVVGAASVVTRNIPEGELWAGNPARFVRKLSEKELTKYDL